MGASAAVAGSLRFTVNPPAQYEFADIPKLPAEFGRGEFTFELWIKPDQTLRTGDADPATYSQLKLWTLRDPEPYSSHGWWIRGNWLLDGHTRPEGFDGGNSREGTFSLNFYGGGRLRWMFADKKEGMPKGMVYAVQVWPAKDTPSLLDGKWHHVAAVRRWREPSGAILELWVDGVKLATTEIPDRTDMRKYWDHLAHPKDPKELGGWALGAEVMTAWNYAFTQFEDYKGLVDEIRMWRRALAPAEIETAARGDRRANTRGLLSHFPFDEKAGSMARDRLNPTFKVSLHGWSPKNWSKEDAPAK
jgi:hypothetical protein